MIEIEFNVPLSPAAAWDYMTGNSHLAKWWGAGVTLDPVVGGNFLEPWTDDKGKQHITMGRVTAVEPKKRLQLDWQAPGWEKPTRVEILLSPVHDGTKIYLQHSGWDMFDGKDRQQKVDQHAARWGRIIEKYRKYCAA